MKDHGRGGSLNVSGVRLKAYESEIMTSCCLWFGKDFALLTFMQTSVSFVKFFY